MISKAIHTNQTRLPSCKHHGARTGDALIPGVVFLMGDTSLPRKGGVLLIKDAIACGIVYSCFPVKRESSLYRNSGVFLQDIKPKAASRQEYRPKSYCPN